MNPIIDRQGRVVEYEHCITNSIFGCLLVKRGVNDNHVCLVMIVEDDGYWFISRNHRFSADWIPEYQELIQKVKDWIEQNCKRTKKGWEFK